MTMITTVFGMVTGPRNAPEGCACLAHPIAVSRSLRQQQTPPRLQLASQAGSTECIQEPWKAWRGGLGHDQGDVVLLQVQWL